jgi:metal-dependent amidase/aminoacylase/carboxypeptidase family protein
MDIGFDKLREHLRPTYRGHRTITNGGIQPNIIPDSGQIWWFVRDASGPWAKENFDKLVNIGRGAALMTDTTMEMEPFGAAWPSLGNKAIAEAIQKNIEFAGMPKWTEDEQKFARELQKSLNKKERPAHESSSAQCCKTEQFFERHRRYHLGCPFGDRPLSVGHTRRSSTPLDGRYRADHVDRS